MKILGNQHLHHATASSPLDGNWLQSSLAYILAKIINDFPHYIGLTENTFKDNDDDKRIV